MHVDDTKLKAAEALLEENGGGIPCWAILETLNELFNKSKKTATPPNYLHGYQDALRDICMALADLMPSLEAR